MFNHLSAISESISALGEHISINLRSRPTNKEEFNLAILNLAIYLQKVPVPCTDRIFLVLIYVQYVTHY